MQDSYIEKNRATSGISCKSLEGRLYPLVLQAFLHSRERVYFSEDNLTQSGRLRHLTANEEELVRCQSALILKDQVTTTPPEVDAPSLG